MCGIYGYIGQLVKNHHSFTESLIMQMGDRIIYRGPDGSGVWHDGELVAMGHRRLSIVDVSDAGSQPMISHNGRFVITFNGEIYNYEFLRKELELSGITTQWRGHSDTEVLLECFNTWGIKNTLLKCIGMFAFAVWDKKNRTLTLARDRIGEKPLYYGWQGSGSNRSFIFASDLNAFKVHPSFEGIINKDAISLFISFNTIPSPYSIYKNISKLEPGCMMVLEAQSGLSKTEVYWSLIEKKLNIDHHTNYLSDIQVVEELENLLSSAVKLQMVADVPVGAFLSGGIDSSLIVALMQLHSEKPINTFSIGFEEYGFNEASYAKSVAKHLKTNHTELYVNSKQAIDVIPKIPMLYSEPFSDSSQIPTYLVSSLAKTKVTVSLSGDGGDELFGGYTRYLMVKNLWDLIYKIPMPVRRFSKNILSSIPNSYINILDRHLPANNILFKLKYGSRFITSDSIYELYSSIVTHWDNSTDIVFNSNKSRTKYELLFEKMNNLHKLDYMMIMDMLTYLPDDILVKVDRAAMGVSLESRIPFLDYRVLEYALSLPIRYKFRDGKGKWILRQILSKYLPKYLFERPKMGFGVPIEIWLRGPLRDWAEYLLDATRLKNEGFFDPNPIRKKWNEHLLGKRNWHYHLWDILMFQAWLDKNKNN